MCCGWSSSGIASRRLPGPLPEAPMRIIAGHWYSWQMIPDKLGAPYFAPIRICAASLGAHDLSVIDLTYLCPAYGIALRGATCCAI